MSAEIAGQLIGRSWRGGIVRLAQASTQGNFEGADFAQSVVAVQAAGRLVAEVIRHGVTCWSFVKVLNGQATRRDIDRAITLTAAIRAPIWVAPLSPFHTEMRVFEHARRRHSSTAMF